MNLRVEQIAKSEVLEAAFEFVFHKRKARSADDDIWHVAFHWPEVKQKLIEKLTSGHYHFSPMRYVKLESGGMVGLWSAEDAILLKAIAMQVEPLLRKAFDLSSVAHIKDGGGLTGAIKKAKAFCRKGNPFIYKTDIADFYRSMDHDILLSKLSRVTNDARMMDLFRAYCERLEIVNGQYQLVKGTGIPKGCSLSPLLGAIYLSEVDGLGKAHRVKYVRYMDDLLFVSDKRWRIKRVIRKVLEGETQLKQSLSREKTHIGRARKGFDWLGFHFDVVSVKVALRTILNHLNRKARLEEQGAAKSRIEQYCDGWMRWCQSMSGTVYIEGGLICVREGGCNTPLPVAWS